MGLVGVWALPATTSVRAPGRGGGQEAPGHRLVTLGPAPVRADRPVEQDQLQRPGGGAFGQHGQVPGGDPAVPAPHEPVVGQRLAGQERADRGGQVLGPFQGQAGEPERLHERPDEQRVLPDAVYLAEQQQASGIQRPPGRRPRRGFDHQARVGDREFGHRPVERVQRRHARHTSSMARVSDTRPVVARGQALAPPGKATAAAIPAEPPKVICTATTRGGRE